MIDTSSLVSQFISEMLAVRRLQNWLLLTASHLRISIASGESDAKLSVMADYLDKQGASLKDFIKGLDEAPIVSLSAEPEVKTQLDPKAN